MSGIDATHKTTPSNTREVINPLHAELFNTAQALAMHRMLEEGEVTPLIILVDDKNKTMDWLVPASANTHEEKDSFAQAARVCAIAMEEPQAIFLAESWTARFDTPEDHKAFEAWRQNNLNASFSDYPGKGIDECVIAVIQTIGLTSICSFKIERHGRRGIIRSDTVDITEWSANDGQTSLGGRFANLLPPRPIKEILPEEGITALKELSELYLSRFAKKVPFDDIKSEPDISN